MVNPWRVHRICFRCGLPKGRRQAELLTSPESLHRPAHAFIQQTQPNGLQYYQSVRFMRAGAVFVLTTSARPQRAA